LPAHLGVTVDKGDDAYTITLPEDTENVTFTATVDGVATEDNPFVVERAAEDGDSKTVVVTATANGTDVTKTYNVTVPAKGVVGPVIAEDDVEINKGKGDKGAYVKQKGTGYVIATIAAGDIDPTLNKVYVGGVEFYYVASRNYFVGIVPEYETKAALIADVEIADGASDTIKYGKDPAADQSKAITTTDFGIVKRIALAKVANPSDKELLASDVGNGVMDGEINTVDFGAVKRVALKKDADLAINTAQ
jgi:hypothetical protein